ncbi:MAG TPA: molybdopterin-dependent oxidoreductase, partial [Magnetospirillaceae bacterium]|nr:molybdopterin-dependent oxidoreductase [Magnetospirillaceae bacterium]
GFDSANLPKARLIILWGANILEARLGTELPARLLEAVRKGTRVVCVDPRRTGTAVMTGAWWIPVLPGTDAALMLAVLHVLLAEGLADRGYARARAVGFDELADYVLGKSGGPARDPEWASPVCGVPPGEIRRLAREYGNSKPALLLPGYSIQRVFAAGDPFRLAVALQLATGNFGVPGGSTGSINNRLPGIRVGTLDPLDRPDGPRVPVLRWPDAVLEGRAGGYPRDIRAAYVCGSNLLNQGADIGKSVRAFRALDFAVCHEMFLTPTARHCDLVFPAASPLEKEDIGIPWAGNWLTYKKAACAPRGLARTDYDIFAELADILGCRDAFTEGRTARGWLDFFLEISELPDPDGFRETGFYMAPDQERTGLADFARDPKAYPLLTPSGLVELSSARYESDTGFPCLPVWREPPGDARHPLSLVTPKSPRRTHSQGGSAGRALVTMHPRDAAVRGILSGMEVRIRNARGSTRAAAELSESILLGVASLYEGVWFDPGPYQAKHSGAPGSENPEDLAGSANVLTGTEGAGPAAACAMHGIPVEIEPIL